MPRGRRNKIQALYEAFAGTPRDYSPTPFVFLNDDVDISVTGEILNDLSEKGFTGVVLSARSGLSVPFASKEYWRKLSAVIDRARELSMFVWLTDDYNHPSGTGAGRLLIERPDFCARGLVFRTSQKPHPRERIVGAYLTKGGSVTHLTENQSRKRCIIASSVAMDAATFSLTGAPWLPEGLKGSLDILNPDAVGYYVTTVLGSLEENLKEYFGSTVTGILIQSPQNQCPFPWTESLPVLFKMRFGYDLIACLPCLVMDVGDFLTVRADYYALIASLTRDYYRSVRQWAENHSLSFSASVGTEGFIENLPHTQGSPHAALSEMNIIGTDYRCNGTNCLNDAPPSLFRNFTPKFASSVAGIEKQDRTLSVVWQAEGWGVTPLLLKRAIDCGASLGITNFIPHGVFSSIVGLRKRDFPPSYHVQLPYWEDIDILSSYISRTCLMMSAGRRQADILVFFPLTSLWVNTLGLGRFKKDGDGIVDGIKVLIRALLSDQRDFDFLFEETVDSRLIRFNRGMVIIGSNRYSTLIVPWATHIPESTFSFIVAARKSGVNVVFVGRYPRIFHKSETPTVGIGLTLVKDAADLIDYLRLKSPKSLSISGDNSEQFVHQKRTYAGADIYFLSYLGDEPFTGTLTLSGAGNPEAWDPENGRRYVISEFEVTNNGIRFPIHFEQGRSWIYVVHSEHTDALYGLPGPPGRKIGEFFFPGRWAVRYRSDNMLRVGNFRLIRSFPVVSFPPLRDLIADNRFGFIAKVIIAVVRVFTETAGRIWGVRKKIRYRSYTSIKREIGFYFLAARLMGLRLSGTSRYQQNELIKDTARYMGLLLSTPLPPEGAEFEIEANFMVGHIPSRIFLVWEDSGEPIEIYINGILVTDRGQECFLWDRKNRRADLSDIVRWGTNRIGIRSRQPGYSTMIPALHCVEPVVITGDFDVNLDIITARKETTRHLSWGRKATGNYSGTISYTARFRLPKRFMGKAAVLDLGDVRVAARVVLNGRDMGVRLWPPYRYDVSDALIDGENEIELSVKNTPENLLGIPVISGIVGDPKIVFFDSK